MEINPAEIKELMTIPGIGKSMAVDLWNLNIRRIEDLKGKNPDLLYILHNDQRGQVTDICVLYTFRCAFYFAETPKDHQDPEKLKWWNWMDPFKITSVEKDLEIRINHF